MLIISLFKCVKLRKTISVFRFVLILIVQPNLRKFQSLFVIVEKLKSQILSFIICEELSAAQKLESEQILSLQNSRIVKIKRTVRQRFFCNRVCLFSFLLWMLTFSIYEVGDCGLQSYQTEMKLKRVTALE